MSESTQAGAAVTPATEELLEDMLELSDILVDDKAEVLAHLTTRVGVNKRGRITGHFAAPGETTLSHYYKLLAGTGKKKASQADAAAYMIRTKFNDKITGMKMPAEVVERYGGSWKRYMLENPNGRRLGVAFANVYAKLIDVVADVAGDEDDDE